MREWTDSDEYKMSRRSGALRGGGGSMEDDADRHRGEKHRNREIRPLSIDIGTERWEWVSVSDRPVQSNIKLARSQTKSEDGGRSARAAETIAVSRPVQTQQEKPIENTCFV